MAHCKECHNTYAREKHYPSYRETHITNVRRNNKKMHYDKYVKIYDYLLDHPCVDCGETNPLVLEFDHREPKNKTATIAIMLMHGNAWAKIADEIAKCDVRCANCHSLKTARDREYMMYKIALERGHV